MLNEEFTACSANGLHGLHWKASQMSSLCSGVICSLPPASCHSKLPCHSKCWCQLTAACLFPGPSHTSPEICTEQSQEAYILPVAKSGELSLVVWMMPFSTIQPTATAHAHWCYQLSRAQHLLNSYIFCCKLLVCIFTESEVIQLFSSSV
jgi:hypothetical protein